MMHRSLLSSAPTSIPDLQKQAPESTTNSRSGSPSLRFDLGSTPQLSVEVDDTNNNNKYKNMLRYLPNAEFQGELSNVGVSVPNTFKHKSHPNARTKEHIGMPYLDEESELNPVKTSTVKDINLETSDATPSWMPAELGDKWDSSSGPGAASVEKSAELDFLNSMANTFIHNPPTLDQEAVSTPMWKKMSKAYQQNDPLQSIFETADDSNLKSKGGLSMSSVLSTPVATKDADIHLTHQQIHQLEDILEKAKDEPDDYQIRGSPLKLFGSEYDTFTKAILTRFVEKVRSNANSVQRTTQAVAAPPVPKLKIKNFTKSGDYTDQDFLKNANSLFAHIQQRGYKTGNVFNKTSNESITFQRSLSQNQNTATSTPKIERTKDIDVIDSLDEYSSYSTDFDENSSVESFDQKEENQTDVDRNEYTSFDKTYKETPTTVLEIEQDNASSYTFDELTELEKQNNTESTDGPELLDNAKVRSIQKDTSFADASMSSVKQFRKNNREDLSKHDTYDDFEFSEHSDTTIGSQQIMWKRPSQLRLPLTGSVKSNVMKASDADNHVVKGTVKPGVFPDHYGNMVFDFQANKWISKDKENDFPGSLDSIEDLFTNSTEDEMLLPKRNREVSILKQGSRSKRDPNLEVSFQIPNSSSVATSPNVNNVTNVSDLQNLTFSQTNKKLISLITGSTSVSSWDRITSIDLSNNQLENVEGLNKYLPSVRKLDLSNNRVRYIEGLPPALFELNLSKNMVENITSFRKFRDLQVLDVSHNNLENLTALTHNIHLTRLNLSDNNIGSLDGLKLLNGLISLDVSQNNIIGEINFAEFDFPNLQELNLAENKILVVSGLENLPNLRVLNLNENDLSTISCGAKHVHLKKLLLKFNRLKDLDLSPYPFLRVLRIDGNILEEIPQLNKLKFLQEVSAKCQDSSSVAMEIISDATDVITMDLSGNVVVSSLFSSPTMSINPFMNLNALNLSAVGLTDIPESFGDMFLNVRDLNLNFNKLTSLGGLNKLPRLKKLHLLSNNIDKIEMVLSNLSNSRRSLKVLDMRLNAINFEFYPYVFNPLELEFTNGTNNGYSKTSPIQLEALDDIENFSIHYNSLVKSQGEWEARDSDFVEKLRKDGNYNRVKERHNYETILINFFVNMRELDGGSVSPAWRDQVRLRIRLADIAE